ncbi:MAG: hypothetical protein ACI9MB_004134, partial [Verrucomicrobiales bacterium]
MNWKNGCSGRFDAHQFSAYEPRALRERGFHRESQNRPAIPLVALGGVGKIEERDPRLPARRAKVGRHLHYNAGA